MQLDSTKTYTVLLREVIVNGCIEHPHETIHTFNYKDFIKIMMRVFDPCDSSEKHKRIVTIENNVIRVDYSPEYYYEYIILRKEAYSMFKVIAVRKPYKKHYNLPEPEASQPAPEDEFDEEALIEMLMKLDAGTSRTSRTSHLLFEEDYWDEDLY
jgi:hypothetical protein